MSDKPLWPWELSDSDARKVEAFDAYLRKKGVTFYRSTNQRMAGLGQPMSEADGREFDAGLLELKISGILKRHMVEVVAAGGRAWYRNEITWSQGRFSVELDTERPPDVVPALPLNSTLRTVGGYVRDLEMYPRSPERVPGWMKVELAAVGAWDLVADEPRWDDGEPTGVPMTPESAGVPAPPGAKYALHRPDRAG